MEGGERGNSRPEGNNLGKPRRVSIRRRVRAGVGIARNRVAAARRTPGVEGIRPAMHAFSVCNRLRPTGRQGSTDRLAPPRIGRRDLPHQCVPDALSSAPPPRRCRLTEPSRPRTIRRSCGEPRGRSYLSEHHGCVFSFPANRSPGTRNFTPGEGFLWLWTPGTAHGAKHASFRRRTVPRAHLAEESQRDGTTPATAGEPARSPRMN